MAHRLAHVHAAVAVGVAEPPQVGRRGDDQILAKRHDAAGHLAHRVVVAETFDDDFGSVGAAAIRRVLQPVHTFLFAGQIAPVP